MPNQIVGGPGRRGPWSRAGLLLLLVGLNAVAIPVAVVQVRGAYDEWTDEPWVAPHPPTAAEPLAVGSPAADFELPRADGGGAVRLAALRAGGRPAVLIFSSFTCDFFTYHHGYLKDLFRGYRDRAEFLTVVVREAGHPLPGMEFLKTPVATTEARCDLVCRAVAVRDWPIPTAVDHRDAAVEAAYKAFPLRLVVVSPAGRVAYASTFTGGPFGLDRGAVSRWFADHLGPPAP